MTTIPSKICRIRFQIVLATAAALATACSDSDGLGKYELTPHLALSGTQNAIARIHVARLSALTIYEPVRGAVLENQERAQWWNEFIGAVGKRPFVDVTEAIIGLHGELDLDDPLARAVIVMTGNFEDPKLLVEGFLAFAAEYLSSPPPFVQADYNGSPIFSTKAPTYRNPDRIVEFHFGFPSAKMLIFSQSIQYVRETLDVIHGDHPGITANAGWRSRLDRIRGPSALWAIGDMPASVNEFLGEKVKTEPELQGLTGLTYAREFNVIVKVGAEYRFTADFKCDSQDQARDMAEHVKRARAILPRMIGNFLPTTSPRIDLWESLFDEIFVSYEIDTVKLSLRKDRSEVEEFVRKAKAPDPTPDAVLIPAPFLNQNPQ